MANAMDYKLIGGRLVENQVGIGIDRNAANAPLAAKRRGVGILQNQIDDRLDPRLDAKRALRRFELNVG